MLNQMETIASRRELELFDRKLGALIPGSPKFIWVKMLKRPQLTSGPDINQLFALKSKMNSALDEILAKWDGKFEQFILSIDTGNDFNTVGDLNNDGKEQFKLNSCIRKFELKLINLKPKFKDTQKAKKSDGNLSFWRKMDKSTHRNKASNRY